MDQMFSKELLVKLLINIVVMFVLYLFIRDVSGEWVQTGGPAGTQVTDIANGNKNDLFASSYYGIYHLPENGQHWIKVNSGLPINCWVRTVSCIKSILYAGTRFFGGYKSIDDGRSWTNITSGIPSNIGVYSFSEVNGEIFVGTDSGIYVSKNNGLSWVAKNSGLPAQTGVSVVKSVNSNEILAATKGNAVYYSADMGDSWIFQGTLRMDVSSIVVSKNEVFIGTNFYGVLSSINNGLGGWVGMNRKLPTRPDVTSLALINDTLYAGMFGGVYCYSLNTRQEWVACNYNLPQLVRIESLLPFRNGELLATTDCIGIIHSVDKKNWKSFNSGLPSNCTIRSFAMGNGALYAGGDSGVYVSNDNGINWMPINENLSNVAINALALLNGTLFSCCDSGIYRFDDKTSTWSASLFGENRTIPVKSLSIANDYIFAGTDGNGLYLSKDVGLTWKKSDTGLYTDCRIPSVISYKEKLFAASTFAGIYYSTNLGASWGSGDSGLTNHTVMALAASQNTIFASIQNNGVYRSFDDGANWILIQGTGIPRKCTVNCFAMYNKCVFAGTLDNGIYMTTNDGDQWTSVTDSLPSYRNICSIYASNDTLFVGVENAGVWCRPISEMVGVTKNLDNRFAKTSKCFTNEKITIRLQEKKCISIELVLNKKEQYSVSMYNAIGRLLIKLNEIRIQKGKNNLTLNTQGFPAGLYTIKVQGERNSCVKAITILR